MMIAASPVASPGDASLAYQVENPRTLPAQIASTDRHSQTQEQPSPSSATASQRKAPSFVEQQPWWLGPLLLSGLIFIYQARRLVDRNKQQERRVSRLSRENRRLTRDSRLYRNMAMTDDLTGIPNRRAGAMHLDGLCAFAQQEQSFLGQRPSIAVALLDIDRFKEINDSLGHEVGDRVLWETATTLQKQLRPHDDICRWGGEEFLIILRGMNTELLPEVLNRVRKALQQARVGRKIGVKQLTASVGAAMLETDCNWRSSLDRADKALYRAKSEGRNKVCVAAPCDPQQSYEDAQDCARVTSSEPTISASIQLLA